MLRMVLAIILLLALPACDEEIAAAPPAQKLTIDAVGYYCNMTVVDHVGPKGQVHRAGGEAPLWFSSVRDAVAFTMLPDEPKDVVAVYVHDMGGGRNWAAPPDEAWIDARSAWFVIGSSKRGGMGMAEAVPFADKSEASAFAASFGGKVVDWQGIPQDYILNADEGVGGGQHDSHDKKQSDEHGSKQHHQG